VEVQVYEEDFSNPEMFKANSWLIRTFQMLRKVEIPHGGFLSFRVSGTYGFMCPLRGRNFNRWSIYLDDEHGRNEWFKFLFMMESWEKQCPSPIVRLSLIVFPSRADMGAFIALGTVEDSIARALRNYFNRIDWESYIAPSTDVRQLESEVKPKIFTRLPSR
jgi:hypothetical protein